MCFATTLAPAPVTVRCAVGVRCPPYSSGKRNCLSAEQKCEEVAATASFAASQFTKTLAMPNDRAIVEQAPKSPISGIPSSLNEKVDAVH